MYIAVFIKNSLCMCSKINVGGCAILGAKARFMTTRFRKSITTFDLVLSYFYGADISLQLKAVE